MYANRSSPEPISPPYSDVERNWWPRNERLGFGSIGEWFAGIFVGFRDDPVPDGWHSTKGYVRKALFEDETGSMWTVTACHSIEHGLMEQHAKPYQSYVVIEFKGRVEHRGRSRPHFLVTVHHDDEG